MKSTEESAVPPGWMDPNNVRKITEIASTMRKAATVVEVGSFLGRSALVWSRTIGPEVRIYCVDSWEANWITPEGMEKAPGAMEAITEHGGVYEAFCHYASLVDNITPVRGIFPSPRVRNLIPATADLVFIDADRLYVSTILHVLEAVEMTKNVGGRVVGVHYQPEVYPTFVNALKHAARESKMDLLVHDSSSVWEVVPRGTRMEGTAVA